MKKLFFLLLFPLSLMAQGGAKSAPGGPSNVTLTCKKFVNCVAFDSLTLYEVTGLGAKVLGRAGRTADSSYVFTVPGGKPRFYAVGVSESAHAKVILGEEAQVTMWGDCHKMNYSRAVSSANSAYRELTKRFEAFAADEQTADNELVAARNERNNAKMDAASAKIRALGQAKQRYLDSLRRANPLMGKVAALFVTPDFESANKSAYANETEFLAKEFFKNADLSDPVYNDLPDLMEAFRQYAIMLAVSPTMPQPQKAWADAQLARFKPDSKAYRLAMSGLIAGFQSVNNPNYLDYAARYVKEFKSQDHGEVKRLDMELAMKRTQIPGMEAPDLEGDTPEGGKYALSSMRGKYVLIDFWASWCGPCIREMPNVKASYEKYKDKGFDILGVSLDRDKNAWVNSINQHKMPWKHISDLKGWQSDHAKLYSVSSIPQTLLLDKEGKIIVRNLRGEQLGEKLREIFGE